MRQAIFFLLALATFACAIMLPDDRNTLPVNWKRSIDSRDAESASGHDMSDTSIPEVTEHSQLDKEQERTQTVWNPCPQFNVKCVLDGDWRHPVGELGPKRASCLLSRVQSSCTATDDSFLPRGHQVQPVRGEQEHPRVQQDVQGRVQGRVRGVWPDPILSGALWP